MLPCTSLDWIPLYTSLAYFWSLRFRLRICVRKSYFGRKPWFTHAIRSLSGFQQLYGYWVHISGVDPTIQAAGFFSSFPIICQFYIGESKTLNHDGFAMMEFWTTHMVRRITFSNTLLTLSSICNFVQVWHACLRNSKKLHLAGFGLWIWKFLDALFLR